MCIQYMSNLYCIFLIILLLTEFVNIHLEASCFIFRLMSTKMPLECLIDLIKNKSRNKQIVLPPSPFVSKVIFSETIFCTCTWNSTWNNETLSTTLFM